MKSSLILKGACKALVFCGLFNCALSATAHAQTKEGNTPEVAAPQNAWQIAEEAMRSKLAELQVADSAKRESLLVDWSNKENIQRSGEFSALLKELQSDDNQMKCIAAYLLGLGNYEAAASALYHEVALKYENPPRRWRAFGIPEPHPAAVALSRIGKPAIFYMLVNLETSDDAEVREWSLRVIRQVEGAEVGTFILERAAAKQEDATKKARLQAASQALPKLDSGVNPEFEMIFRKP